jgi:NAD(P)-dependent dehydrogenase (short-subunit alcohol dehydrogenase family)
LTSKPEAVRTAVDEVVNEFERLDVLVNNAGIEKRAEFLEITPEDWQRQLDVEQTRLWTDRERVAVPAKRDSGAPHRRIPAEGEGKIVKFRASFSED